ncbi:MAG: hypothetical protein R3C53_03520 [Pirellulaceae bacterium]
MPRNTHQQIGSEPAALVLDSRFSLLRFVLEVSDGFPFEGDQVGLIDNAIKQGHSHRRIT